MKKTKLEAAILRQRAEKLLKKNTSKSGLLSEAEMRRLIHELEVHQVELEMQHDELEVANNEIENAAEKYIELYDYAPSGYFTLSELGEIIDLNLSGAKMIGKVRSNIKNSSFVYFVTEDSKPKFNLFLRKIFKSKNKEIFEVDLSINRILPFYAQLTGTITENPSHCFVTMVDISERKQAEELLITSEAKYRRLFESAKDGILILDAETGMITDVNPFLIELLGFSKDQFLNKSIWEIGFFKDIVANQEKFIELQQNNYVRYDDLPLETADGRKISVEFVSNVYFEGKKKVIQCNIRDITKRKQTELALHNSERLLQTIIQTIPDLVWLKNMDGVYLSANPMVGRLFNAQTSDIIGKTDYDFVDRELAGSFRKNDHKANETGNPTSNEEWVIFVDTGQRVCLHTIKTPMFDFNGKQIGILGIGHDITERKFAEVNLMKQKEEFETIFNLVPAQIWYKDTLNNFIRVNRQVCNDIGYMADQIEGHSAEELFPSFAQQYFEDDCEVFNTQKSKLGITEQFNNSKGELRLVHTDKIPVFDNNGKVNGLIAFSYDITEFKHSEEKLLKLSSAVEQTVDSIIITDRNGTIEYVNRAFEVLSEYSFDEAVGKTPRILKSGVQNQKFYKGLWKKILSGNVFISEILNKKKNGELYYESRSITPIYDKHKNLTHFVGIGVDITKRKLAEKELKLAKKNAEESDRLKSSFLANMSHEVRTPLNSIIGFSELLVDPDFDEEQKNRFIQQIIRNGKSLLKIISDVMDISKLESGETVIRKVKIDVQQFISSIMEQFILQTEHNKLELIQTIPAINKNVFIFADADRLQQIFSNLIGNAIKFTANGSIEIGYQPKGQMIEFYVKDTGIGIPVEYQDKIFTRFIQVEAESTRKYGGNGLGLAITKSLVELMGGEIWVKSEISKGSAFYFTLPTYNGKLI